MMAIVSGPSFSTPDYSGQLKEIARGPEVCSCQNEGEDESSDADDDSETQRYEIFEEDESNRSIISTLFEFEPVELDERGLRTDPTIFLTVDIPAYNGRPSEQIRTKANPYDLNKFFDESESSIYDYPTMGKLESEVVNYATPKHGRIKPALRRRVQESVAIMKYAR